MIAIRLRQQQLLHQRQSAVAAVRLLRRSLATNAGTTATVGGSTLTATAEGGSSSSTSTAETQQSPLSSTAAAATTSSSSNNNNNSRRIVSPSHIALALASLTVGYVAGSRNGYQAPPHDTHVLPSGYPRTCSCEEEVEKNNNSLPLTEAQQALTGKLKHIVGDENVMGGQEFTTATLPYLKGTRLGRGTALCIVTPTKLHDVTRVVKAIVQADCVVIAQGQNTGLTGGSVPRRLSSNNNTTDTSQNNQQQQEGELYGGRPVVVLSLKKLNRIIPIDDGKRVLCLAGVGLAQLTEFLNQLYPHRESHSLLGSTFLNPTTAAGVALGSGGTQLRKGPAYTERALYLKVVTNKWQERNVEVVNTLGIEGFRDTEYVNRNEALMKQDTVEYKVDYNSRYLEKTNYTAIASFGHEFFSKLKDPHSKAPASAAAFYKQHVCNLDDNAVSRYNADTKGPDLNRSEGKVIILATVHDTFEKPKEVKSFWVSFDSLETALAFRREVCLQNPDDLPISLEYMDRDAFEVVDQAGRGMALAIQFLGMTSPFLRQLWNIKLWIESVLKNPVIIDHVLYKVNPLVPSVLPSEIQTVGQTYDHHVAMEVGEFGDGNLERILQRMTAFEKKYNKGLESSEEKKKVVIYDASEPRKSKALNAFRFVAASAFRTWCVGQGAQGFSVDYALPKNGGTAPPISETAIAQPIKRMRYSHFGCNVVHEDLAYEPGVDVNQCKYDFKNQVEFECGGKLPAEHGHGTEYVAPPEAQERWKRMDPLNVLNPGIGGLSDKFKYKEQPQQ